MQISSINETFRRASALYGQAHVRQPRVAGNLVWMPVFFVCLSSLSYKPFLLFPTVQIMLKMIKWFYYLKRNIIKIFKSYYLPCKMRFYHRSWTARTKSSKYNQQILESLLHFQRLFFVGTRSRPTWVKTATTCVTLHFPILWVALDSTITAAWTSVSVLDDATQLRTCVLLVSAQSASPFPLADIRCLCSP